MKEMKNVEDRLAAGSSPTDYCLRVAEGTELVGRTYALATVTRVGRDPSSDIFVSDPRVARAQFILRWNEDKCCHAAHEAWYRPVLVNGVPVLEFDVVELKEGDRITAASTTFVFERRTVDAE